MFAWGWCKCWDLGVGLICLGFVLGVFGIVWVVWFVVWVVFV